MESENSINTSMLDEVRQIMNNAGAFYLTKEKVEEGGSILKRALHLSDTRGIVLTENVCFVKS